jgi:single stranded DNA-binding protein
MHKNRIELEGFLGHKPEARDLPSGMRVANARLAEESYRYRDDKGNEQARTTWHSIVLYGGLASLAETFEKGENVRIVGTLLSRQFTPKDGSKPRTVWEVVAREAYVIAPRRGGKAALAAHSPAAPKPLAGAEETLESAPRPEDVPEDGTWV